MNDGPEGFHHGYRVLMLPDISSKVQAGGPFLHAIIDKFEDLTFCLTLGSACHDHGHGAAIDNLLKIFAPIGLNHLGTQFSGDPAAQPEVTGISLFQLFSNSRNRHDGDPIVLTLIHQFSQI